MIHLTAAAAWLGGLVPFLALLRGQQDPARQLDAARRFSLLGVVCVGVILVTGSVNTWFMVRGFPALTETRYGHVLLVKLSLFLVLMAIAGINRFRLTPRLAGGDAARRVLQRNALIEAAIGAAILVVVGVLGTLPPAFEVIANRPT